MSMTISTLNNSQLGFRGFTAWTCLFDSEFRLLKSFHCTNLQWLKKKHKRALYEALEKIKSGTHRYSSCSSQC